MTPLDQAIALLATAIKHADVVETQLAVPTSSKAPALQARNHAATPAP